MDNNKQKVIFSGVQPSGNLHLGNYLGSLAQWTTMQDYKCFFSIVNEHAITVPQDPKELALKTIEILKIYLASGLDPKKVIIFKQSDVAAHTELAWILNCTAARIADLKKMTQFKDKSGKQGEENVSVGLFDYPVLMAADILLYDTSEVPVGDDQLQHVELTRTIARRFNATYGDVFVIPEAVIRKNGARIMDLKNASKKMSKSATDQSGCIALLDDPKVAAKKIMTAVTDSLNEIKFDVSQRPEISNLLTIYSLIAQARIKDLEVKYRGVGYGQFKADLAIVVSDFLIDFQQKYHAISDEQAKKVLADGAKKANAVAIEVLERVKSAVGL